MIYLDNAATTAPAPEVLEAVAAALQEDFGNPSSRHRLGVRARGRIEQTRTQLARWAGIAPQQVVFTSGGTEANNLAAAGSPLRTGASRILTTAAEHSSLSRPLRARGDGEVVELPLDAAGVVDLGAFEAALGPDVGLVALFEGHNEIGSLNPVRQLVELVVRKAPRARIHVDAVQSFGKTGALPFAAGLTSAAISAHKFHGPKGAGALLLGGTRVPEARLVGGGQERDRRSGTENTPGIAGLGAAISLLLEQGPATCSKMRSRKERLVDGIVSGFPDARALGAPLDPERSLPHLVSFVFPGALAEPVLHHLEQQDVFASTGAACQSHRGDLSPSLRALGLSDAEIRSTVRFSLSRWTTAQEVDAVVEILPPILHRLRALGTRR